MGLGPKCSRPGREGYSVRLMVNLLIQLLLSDILDVVC